MDIHPITHLSEDPTNILGDTICILQRNGPNIFNAIHVSYQIVCHGTHNPLSVYIENKEDNQTNLDRNIAIQVDQWM